MTIEDGYMRVETYPVLYDPMWDWPEYKAIQEWFNSLPEERKINRPKDADQDNPNMPTGTQTWTMSWHGYTLTVRELRSWLNQLPNDATLTFPSTDNDPDWSVKAEWDVRP